MADTTPPRFQRLPSTLKRGAFDVQEQLCDKERSAQWHAGRAKDYASWIIPSTLLMTVAFSMVMSLAADSAPPRDRLLQWLTGGAYAGSTAEALIRDVTVHAYLFTMVTSGMAALRCVNDFTTALLLNANVPPEDYRRVHEVRGSDGWRDTLPPRLLPHRLAKLVLACGEGKPSCSSEGVSSAAWLSCFLFGGVNERAYFAAVYRLALGLVLGVFHRCVKALGRRSESTPCATPCTTPCTTPCATPCATPCTTPCADSYNARGRGH